jgi:hypothetical protein
MSTLPGRGPKRSPSQHAAAHTTPVCCMIAHGRHHLSANLAAALFLEEAFASPPIGPPGRLAAS